MSRLFLSLIVGGALFALIGFQMGLFTLTPSDLNPNKDKDEGGGPVVDASKLGGPLYPRLAAVPKLPAAKSGAPVRDAIVFPAHVAVGDKAEVAAPVPGKISFIGEEVPEGAPQVAGVAAFVVPPFEISRTMLHDGEKITLFRRLHENEIVPEGTMVAKMDTTKAEREVAAKLLDVGKALLAEKSAEFKQHEAAIRLEIAGELLRKKVIAEEEYRSAKLTRDSLVQEYQIKKEETKTARVAYSLSLDLLRQHEIRSDLGVTRARIQKIFKHRGETVKAEDTVILLENPDRLVAEGLLEDQFRDRIADGMRVRVEPNEEQAPLRTLKGWHRGEITAVAITRQEDKPRILSASEDATVCVWDLFSENPIRELRHDEPVRALAVSPLGAGHNLVLTGTADGSIHIWDLSVEGSAPIKTIARKHRDAVTALAFTPDGRFFASGGADSDMFMFNADGGDLYPFDAAHGVADPHRGTITALHFTPQGHLISASRDNTLRMWDVCENGARLHGKPITGRTGTIHQLGVSPDGRWMFLDRGKDLQILSAVDGGRYQALQNYSTGSPFEHLAVFAPGSTLMLTAGAAEGRLQLWRAPEDKSRPHEVRQLVTKEGAPVTCAAFSPLADRGGLHALAVSGAKDGSVYLWSLPSLAELDKHAAVGTVTLVSTSSLSGARQMRVRVDVPNPPTPRHPEGRFNPGRPVTIVIE